MTLFSPKTTAGFNLIELMIVLVIIGLMAVYAAPDFSHRVLKSQVAGAVSELQSSFAMARMEALKNARWAVVKTGASDDDFIRGWQVEIPGLASGSNTIVGYFKPPGGLKEFRLNAANNEIRFLGDGRLADAGGRFCIFGASGNSELVRIVTVTLAGQVISRAGASPC